VLPYLHRPRKYHSDARDAVVGEQVTDGNSSTIFRNMPLNTHTIRSLNLAKCLTYEGISPAIPIPKNTIGYKITVARSFGLQECARSRSIKLHAVYKKRLTAASRYL